MYSDQLSDVIRMQLLLTVKFRQFCDAKDGTEKGLHTGQLFNWNTYSRVAQGGGQINENVDMPTTNFTVGQSSLTIAEYGNSVPYTGKLDNFSKHPVTEIIHKVLKVDARETLDGAAWAQFNQTVLQVAPTGGTSATSVTMSVGPTGITNNVALSNSHVKAISDLMKESNIPPYTGDDYYCVAWPTTLRSFKNSLELTHQYVETGFQLIANGEIGRYEGIRFIEQTAIAHGGAVNATNYTFRNPVPWINGQSDWAFFFGEDTVAECMVIPEEIRGKIPTDYGRSRGIAWYYLGGFGLVHGAVAADSSNARIVKWNSAS
jgi:N4-gp56 family major capsid protein